MTKPTDGQLHKQAQNVRDYVSRELSHRFHGNDESAQLPIKHLLWDLLKCGIPSSPSFEERNRAGRMEMAHLFDDFKGDLDRAIYAEVFRCSELPTSEFIMKLNLSIMEVTGRYRQKLSQFGDFFFPLQADYWKQRTESLVDSLYNSVKVHLRDGLCSVFPGRGQSIYMADFEYSAAILDEKISV